MKDNYSIGLIKAAIILMMEYIAKVCFRNKNCLLCIMNPTQVNQNSYREILSKTFTGVNQNKKLKFLFKDTFNGDFIITGNNWLNKRTAAFHIENRNGETYLILSTFQDQPVVLFSEIEYLLNTGIENVLLAAIETYEITKCVCN